MSEITSETTEPDNTTNEHNPESGNAEDGGNLPPSSPDDADTFPRSYVEELRQENGKYRQRAQQADEYATRLHTELVRATGRLADPTDLPFSADHLDSVDGLTAAIEDLLVRKPHLASRRPLGDIGQGPMSAGSANVDLAAILRQRAQ